MRSAWGKYEDEGLYHRIEHHCADVAGCFEALITDDVLAARFARASGSATGNRLDPVTSSRLAVIAFLHDFAKLNAGFQFKVRDPATLPGKPPPRMSHVAEAFYCIEQPDICERLGLYDLLDEWGEGLDALLRGALTHHARRVVRTAGAARARSGNRSPATTLRRVHPCFGDAPRTGSRRRSVAGRPCLTGRRSPISSPASSPLRTRSVRTGTGTSPSSRTTIPPTSSARARTQAREAIAARGLRRTRWPAATGDADFRAMFDHTAPRPLQAAVADAPLDAPLLILESETGSGKTEAAVLRFAALLRAGLVDGLYFAVPTRAAAKQLHERVRLAVRALLPDRWADATALAIPGYCVMGEASGRPEGGFQVYWDDGPDEADRVARWSAESARHFLSAPAAVGTIDQALLGTLKVKWAHLRGAALSRSLLVVDEVHASDAYMTELLATLLEGHLAVGVTHCSCRRRSVGRRERGL